MTRLDHDGCQGRAEPASGQAGERRAAVIGDHVAEGGHDVDRVAVRRAVKLGVSAVQVAHDPLGVRPLGEPAQISFGGGGTRMV